MASRRVSSVVSWLEELSLVEKRNDRFYILIATINNNINMLNFSAIDEPILPRTTELSEYQTVSDRAISARETIISYRNMAATERADNARKQVRNGLSQLYEYQYLQNLEGSNLVLVIEKELPVSSRWMINYLEQNRNINLIWDGDENLYGTEVTREKFEFLNLIPY